MGIKMKKFTLILIVLSVTFTFGFSKVRNFCANGYLGMVYPEKDIRDNYSGRTVFGGGVLYKFNKINATLDYIYYNSKDTTPYTKTEATLEMHNFFLGAELPVIGKKKNQFIGAGASLNFVKEDVGELGRFKSSKTGIFFSAGTRIPLKKFNLGIKMIYNILRVKDSGMGGFFLILFAGF